MPAFLSEKTRFASSILQSYIEPPRVKQAQPITSAQRLHGISRVFSPLPQWCEEHISIRIIGHIGTPWVLLLICIFRTHASTARAYRLSAQLGQSKSTDYAMTMTA